MSFPLVLRVLALELLFEFRIRLRPKRPQAFCDLDRSLVGREDVERERVPAHGDLDIVVNAVEILDPCSEKWLGGLRIGDLRFSTSGKWKPLGRVLVHKLLLDVCE